MFIKNLDVYGVQELDAKEMRETDGGIGFLEWLALAYLGTLAVEAMIDGQKCVDDFIEGFNSAYNS